MGLIEKVEAFIRGAAAGIGREVEPTGVFGWVTGDRLRRVRLIITTKLYGGDVASDLTTDCSGASRQQRRYGAIVCPSERKVVVRARNLVRAEGVR